MTRASDLSRLMGAGGTLNAALSVDTISEKTSGSGVTIDSLNIKDSGIGGHQIGGRRNMIINGGMQVAQRGTSATGLGSGTTGYVALDRFRLEKADSPTARYTMTQDSNAPVGFANSMKVAVTTADTSVGADVHQYIDQFIEAQNLQQLAYGTSSAERITLSFYVKCSTAQTFALDLVNEDNSRYFNTTYTVSSADTWERKIITFPADTASGFNNDNGRGLRVRWTLVAGSNLTDGSVSTAWSGTQHIATNHANTWVGATSRAWQLTGVQLEVGSQATPFEHLSFGETLALAQRYYQKITGSGSVYVATNGSSTTSRINGMWATTMRATPTSTIDSGWTAANLNNMYQAYKTSGDHTFPNITADAEL